MSEFIGCHIMIDATSESDKLNDANKTVEFLELLVEKINMTMILPPITVKFPHTTSEMSQVLRHLIEEGLGDCDTAEQIETDLHRKRKKMYGYSSFVMIAESHIALHTFPAFGYLSFDCYSCRKFDQGIIIDSLADFFDTDRMIVQMNDRRIPK